MERDSFIFYRSFYEAIRCMPVEVQAEIYPAIIKYAITGEDPEGLSPIAGGIFLLCKPVLDIQVTRSRAGSKGGRKRGTTTLAAEATTPPAPYAMAIGDEVKALLVDLPWVKTVCERGNITAEQLQARLDEFGSFCIAEGKKHDSLSDAKRHFNAWMRKAFNGNGERKAPPAAPVAGSPQPTDTPPFSGAQVDYAFNGGFGGKDT